MARGFKNDKSIVAELFSDERHLRRFRRSKRRRLNLLENLCSSLVERANPANTKRWTGRVEFEAYVRRLDRSFEIRRLRKGIDFTDSDLRRGAEKMLRGNQDFGGFAFDLNTIGIEESIVDSGGGGLNGPKLSSLINKQ